MLDEFPQGHTAYDVWDCYPRREGVCSRLFYRYECEFGKRDDYKNKGALYFDFGTIVVVWEVEL